MLQRIFVVLFAAVLIVMSAPIESFCQSATTLTPQLKTAANGQVQYYLSLPGGWTPDRAWPIVVTIVGSGHDFMHNCQIFRQARSSGQFIIITPCVSSNGMDPADEQNVLAIVKEVQEKYRGEPKFFLTGFSAGGHVAWQIIFSHPELLAGAVLAAGNYIGRGITTISRAPERTRLPIIEFQGDADPSVVPLTNQWENAQQVARSNGYQNLTRTIVPGASHGPFPEKAMDFFAGILQH